MFLSALLLSAFSVGAAPTGLIAYLSGSGADDLCVCLVDIATGDIARLGRGQRDGAPVWSPDGRWLAFASRRDEGLGIYVARADGSEMRPIPHARAWNRSPVWSPDGTKLAYVGGTGSDRGIMVYDWGDESERAWGSEQPGLVWPAWTGDGNIVAIGLVGEPGRWSTDLFVVTPESARPLPKEALPSEKGTYVEYAVTTDRKGRTIAFESNDGGDREIFVLSLKRGAYDISNHRAADWNPVWAPDGRSLLFESFRGGRRGIYLVYPDTLRVAPVVSGDAWDDWHPSWSPDGRWLAFVSDRTGDPEVFVADISGKHVRQVTRQTGPDYAPAWQPLERR